MYGFRITMKWCSLRLGGCLKSYLLTSKSNVGVIFMVEPLYGFGVNSCCYSSEVYVL